jgi:hypothetical protein
MSHHLATRPIDVRGVVDDDLRLLCRGLLLREPARRFGAAEVARWLAGDATLAVDADAVGVATVVRPYRIGTAEATSVAELAVVLARHWDAARRDLARGQVARWLEHELHDYTSSARCATCRTCAASATTRGCCGSAGRGTRPAAGRRGAAADRAAILARHRGRGGRRGRARLARQPLPRRGAGRVRRRRECRIGRARSTLAWRVVALRRALRGGAPRRGEVAGAAARRRRRHRQRRGQFRRPRVRCDRQLAPLPQRAVNGPLLVAPAGGATVDALRGSARRARPARRPVSRVDAFWEAVADDRGASSPPAVPRLREDDRGGAPTARRRPTRWPGSRPRARRAAVGGGDGARPRRRATTISTGTTSRRWRRHSTGCRQRAGTSGAVADDARAAPGGGAPVDAGLAVQRRSPRRRGARPERHSHRWAAPAGWSACSCCSSACRH